MVKKERKQIFERLLLIEEHIYDIYQNLRNIEFCQGRLNKEYFEKYHELNILFDFEMDILKEFNDYKECLFFAKKISQIGDFVYDLDGMDLANKLLETRRNEDKELDGFKDKQIYTRTINILIEHAITFFDFKWLDYDCIDIDEYNYKNVSYNYTVFNCQKNDIYLLVKDCNIVNFDNEKNIAIMGRDYVAEQLFLLLETNFKYDIISAIESTYNSYITKELIDYKYDLIYNSGSLEKKYFGIEDKTEIWLVNKNNKVLYELYSYEFVSPILNNSFINILRNINDNDLCCININKFSLLKVCDSIIEASLKYLNRQELMLIIKSLKEIKDEIPDMDAKEKIYSKLMNICQ